MIRIGFLMNFPKEYKGGINYLKNLFFALANEKEKKFEILLFVPSNIEDEYIENFSSYITVVKTSIIKRWSIYWLIDKILGRIINYTPFQIALLKKNNIDTVSHSNFSSILSGFTVINWIPDFQWLHYPGLWKEKSLKRMKYFFSRLIDQSDVLIVSSYDAQKDIVAFKPGCEKKVEVLQFVSQPNKEAFSSTSESLKQAIETKYNFHGRFVYLPNQFWSHKNHMVVFKAIKLLKEKGIELLLITTGLMHDFRNSNHHIEGLVNFVETHNLQNNIRFLGLIPYEEVLFLMKRCVTLINPSLFEGWSSTVEEAKSMGKKIVLSDIPVHREQNPQYGTYFDPADEIALASILEDIWINQGEFSDNNGNQEEVKKNLEERTHLFARRYQEIILKNKDSHNRQ